jgi:SAM-dependent methyltransferase
MSKALIGREDSFTVTYSLGLWGKSKEGFYSGPGSEYERAKEYIDYVRGFIRENKVRSVIDLGCGDFRVAQYFAREADSYVGCDIVKPLIDSNTARFGTNGILFRYLDIVRDELPQGDLCLARQVLQHLSNDDVKKVLRKMRKYKHVLITDELLNNLTRVNADIRSGRNTRLTSKSNLLLERPPFNAPLEVVLLADIGDYFTRTVLLGKDRASE